MKQLLKRLGVGVLVLLIIGVSVRYINHQYHQSRDEPLIIQVLSPLDSAIIYADSIHIIGTTTGIIQLQADLLVDGGLIASEQGEFSAGDWELALQQGYDGDPTEANLRVFNSETGEIYQESVILISQLSERPDGTWGRVVSPILGLDIGGDDVVVQGRVSGIIDEVVTVQLLDDNQTILDQQTITVHNRNGVDDMPFRVALSINQKIGLAIVQINFEQLGIEETIPINLVGAAG